MRTVVITGGTDGLGKGLALHYLRQGAHVVAVGSTEAKGRALLKEAAGAGRARFVRADLTSVAATRDLVRRLTAEHPVVDKLILCAQRYRPLSPRTTTAEGFEHSFALAYHSRHVLSHGLLDALRAARRPVVMNVGTPGVPLGRLHWDDPQLTRSYSGTKATLQSFRAWSPPACPRACRNPCAPVAKATPPMTALLDDPPGEPFTAYWRRRRLSLDGRAFDRDDALRLHDLTRSLIHR